MVCLHDVAMLCGWFNIKLLTQHAQDTTQFSRDHFCHERLGSGLALFVGPKRERRKGLVSTVCANCYWFSSNAKISLLGGAEQKKKHSIYEYAIIISNVTCSEAVMRRATNVARKNLISLGTCIGKFTKSGKFHLQITALDIIAPYAKVGMSF